jgi:hypothetical protein
MDVLDGSAPRPGGFESQADAGPFCLKIVGQYMPDATGGFAAAGNKAATGTGNAIADYYIFGRAVDSQTIGIATGFQAEIVVIAINIAIFDKNKRRRVNINPVGAWAITTDIIKDNQTVNGNIFGI